MKIIYAGTPDFAVPALEALISSDHEVCAVYTQPDRPAGRGKRLRASPVKLTAESAGIPVFQPLNLKSESDQRDLAALQADIMVVAAYGLILPRAVLDAPRFGCINIHASLLPRWRGAAPIQRSILAGDKVTGVTIMQMAEGLDTGDMLAKIETEIQPDDTAALVHDRLSVMGAEALMKVLASVEQGTLDPQPQDESLTTYAVKLSKSEAKIDWHEDAVAIVRRIQAFNPWPVAQTGYDELVLRIWEARVVAKSANAEPGTVLEEDRSGILVQAGSDAVSLQKLQLPGGKPLAAADFLNGHSLLGKLLQ